MYKRKRNNHANDDRLNIDEAKTNALFLDSVPFLYTHAFLLFFLVCAPAARSIYTNARHLLVSLTFLPRLRARGEGEMALDVEESLEAVVGQTTHQGPLAPSPVQQEEGEVEEGEIED